MAYDVDTKPAAYARARARRHTRELVFAFAAALVLGISVLVAGFGLRNNVAAFALVLAMYGASRIADGRAELYRRWTMGANAEAAVGDVLNDLQRHGYVVMHDVEDTEGNIDHLVSGPTGVFVIETKARSYLRKHVARTARQAMRVHDALGVWITPVICLPKRGGSPWRVGKVWIVPGSALVDWIRGQRNARADFEQLARFADRH